jgi:hypothetical protein
MSDDSLLRDSLLRKLGQLAREQDTEAPPAELLSANPEAAQARIAEKAVAALAPKVRPARAAQPRPFARYFFALFVPLAGAAALVLLIPRSARQPGAPLPAYGLEVSGGVAEVRAATPVAAPLVLEPGVRVELRLRPKQAVEGPVDARLYWRSGRDLRRWPVRAQVSAEGVLRVIAPAESPFGPGEGEVIAIVARPAALPDQVDLATLENGRADWQILRWAVRWR